jgi:pilus assembly protein CpaB
LATWPRDQAPPGSFTDLQSVLGKVVKNSFSVSQPIVAAALLEPEKTGGVLPLLIPPGMRAMSIAVDDVTDMAGFILPHSRVDVLVSVAVGGGPMVGAGGIGNLTKIVLQNIKVLAVAQTLEAGPDQPHQVKVVTLLVTAEEAERLAAAGKVGTLTLAMRNFEDEERLATSGVTLPTLLGMRALEQSPPSPPAQQAPVLTDHKFLPRRDHLKAVEVIRNGTDHQTVEFSARGRVRPAASSSSTPQASASPPATETAPPTQ